MRGSAFIFCLITIVGLAACGHEEKVSPTAAPPTRTLRPPTATPSLEPNNLTPTPTDLPSPLSLSPAVTEVSMGDIPPQVQNLIQLTEADLIQQHRADPKDIRLLTVEAFNWPDETWNCPEPSEQHDAGAGYRIVFSVNSQIYTYHTDQADTFFLCEDRAWLALEGEPIPLDPIALSMVDLAARDAAKTLDVSPESLHLTSLLALNWLDSSLGCPKPTGVYSEEVTPGWRIVFRSDDQLIIYHTSVRNFVRCSLEEEILPGMLRQALPRVTPTP